MPSQDISSSRQCKKRAALDYIANLCVTRWHTENVKNMCLIHLSHFECVCEHLDLDLD